MSLRAFNSDLNFVVLDPTVHTWQNVTPNCYRIEEVFEIFRRFTGGLEALKERIAECFGGDASQLNQASMNSLVGMKLDEWYGDKGNVVANLFGLNVSD